LSRQDGLALFHGLTGGFEVGAEASSDIVALSDGLPLAIRIAAGRLAWRPDLPATEFTERLADRSRRLDELQLDDLAVRACIRTGYDALLSEGGWAEQLAARAFRMLGLLHVPDFGSGVVAAMLAERDIEAVLIALDRLFDAQLLELTGNGRYRLHDLVRLVAAERAREEDAAAVRDRAVEDAISFYTGALWSAETWIRAGRVLAFSCPQITDGPAGPAFGGSADARRWIDAEIYNLVSVADQAAETVSISGRLLMGLYDLIWTNLDVRCEWQVAHRMTRLLLEVAGRRADDEMVAYGRLLHGRSRACLGAYDEALEQFLLALDSLHRLDSHPGVVLALNALGIVYQRRREPVAALSRFTEAHTLAHEHGLNSLAATVLSNMSVAYSQVGKLDDAIIAAEQGAVASAREANLVNRTATMVNAAAALLMRGDITESVQRADEAVVLSRETGDRMRESEALVIRCESNLRRTRLLEALADADGALQLARSADYRYVAVCAQHQRARILSAMGRDVEAAHARKLADKEDAQLGRAHRDPTIELLLAKPPVVTAE
jgi:tetratricopeptide (TPR) repeat protein